MTNYKTTRHNKKVLILLAPGFEEGSVVYCLGRLREAGLPVALVGLSAGLLNGSHGLTVRPDHSLETLPLIPGHKVVLVPDGKECVSALLADPRVHKLIETTIANFGLIVAMPVAESMLRQVGFITLSTESFFVLQKDTALDVFASYLLNLIVP